MTDQYIERLDCPYNSLWVRNTLACLNGKKRETFLALVNCDRFSKSVPRNYTLLIYHNIEEKSSRWCVGNTTHRFTTLFSDHRFLKIIFENEHDAILFKMTFPESSIWDETL